MKRDSKVVEQIAAQRRGFAHTEEAKVRMARSKARPVDGVLPPDGICTSDYELLRLFPMEGTMSVADLALMMPHLSVGAVRQRVHRCKKAGHIQSDIHGRYRLRT